MVRASDQVPAKAGGAAGASAQETGNFGHHHNPAQGFEPLVRRSRMLR